MNGPPPRLLLTNQQHKEAGLRKQLLKKRDILAQLHQRGFSIGYTSVCNYIRSKQVIVAVQEAYIRQQYAPGQACEFDWAEVKLWIGGVLCRLQLAVFTSCYSNYRYERLYVRQDTLSFMESHVSFFKSLGYVYPELVYDNMRVAAAKFTGPHEKEPTQALLKLQAIMALRTAFVMCDVAMKKATWSEAWNTYAGKASGLRPDSIIWNQPTSG